MLNVSADLATNCDPVFGEEVAMTQELVLIVLLTGLIGLIWIMTLGTIDDDDAGAHNPEPGTASAQSDDAQHAERALNRQTIVA